MRNMGYNTYRTSGFLAITLCGVMVLFAACENPIAQAVKALREEAVSPVMAIHTADELPFSNGATLDFGVVNGSIGQDRIIVIGNTGKSALIVTQKSLLTLTGAPSTDFQVSTVLPLTVAAESRATLMIKAKSAARGLQEAQLILSSNDPDQPLFQIKLASALVGPPATVADFLATASSGQVELRWSAVAGATGYNLYWSTNSTFPAGSTTKVPNVASPHKITGLANNQDYFMAVSAVNAYGESPRSDSKSARPVDDPPGLPANLKATAGDESVTLSWDAAVYAQKYRIYWSPRPIVQGPDGLPPDGTASIETSNTFQIIPELANGSPWYFRILSINGKELSALSPETSATPRSSIPAAPADLQAAASSGQVELRWSAVAGATGYNLYWSTDSTFPAGSTTKVPSVTSPHKITGLANNQDYFMAVSAVNAHGESARSAASTARPVDDTPGVPANLKAIAGDASVRLTWDAAIDARKYRVYWHTSSFDLTSGTVPTDIQTAETDTLYWDHPNPDNGTRYCYQLLAINGTAISPASSLVSALPLDVPKNLVATGKNGEASLTWTAVPGITQYLVYQSISTITSPQGLTPTPTRSPSLTVTGLSNGATYFFAVSCVLDGTESLLSPSVMATPVAPPANGPTGLMASGDYGGNNLQWNTVAGAAGYKIYRSTSSFTNSNDPGVTLAKTVTGASTLNAFDSGLNDNTLYYYRVSAVNNGGESALSAQVVSARTLIRVSTVTISRADSPVHLDSTGASMLAGTTLQLNAAVAPGNATDKEIIWSVDDTSKFSVNSSGLVSVKGNAAHGDQTVVRARSKAPTYAEATFTIRCFKPQSGNSFDLRAEYLFDGNLNGSGITGLQAATATNYAYCSDQRGRTNQAIQKADSSQAYFLDAFSNYAFKAENSFSISLWIRIDETSSTASVFEQASIPAEGTYVSLVKKGSSLEAKVGRTGTAAGARLSTAAFSGTGWHHVVLVWGGSTATLYLDNKAGNNSSSGGAPYGANHNNNSLRFLYPGMSGAINNLRIYNTALSTTEIQYLYDE